MQTKSPDQPLFKRYNYIFIVTYARSGSTLLQSLINSAPGVQIRGENNNTLFHLFRAFQSSKDTKQRGEHNQQLAPDTPWYGAGSLKPNQLAKNVVNTFVRTILSPDAGIHTTGFKEIRYVPYFMDKQTFEAYMNFLLREFPNSRIVFNSRDFADVARSGWNQKHPIEKIKQEVQSCDRRFIDYNKGNPRTLHWHYENSLTDPQKIRSLFKFLDLPYDPARVQAVLNKPLNHAKSVS